MGATEKTQRRQRADTNREQQGIYRLVDKQYIYVLLLLFCISLQHTGLQSRQIKRNNGKGMRMHLCLQRVSQESGHRCINEDLVQLDGIMWTRL